MVAIEIFTTKMWRSIRKPDEMWHMYAETNELVKSVKEAKERIKEEYGEKARKRRVYHTMSTGEDFHVGWVITFKNTDDKTMEEHWIELWEVTRKPADLSTRGRRRVGQW